MAGTRGIRTPIRRSRVLLRVKKTKQIGLFKLLSPIRQHVCGVSFAGVQDRAGRQRIKRRSETDPRGVSYAAAAAVLARDFAVLAPKRIRPTGTFENPENGCIVPRVDAVRLPKPGADLAWSSTWPETSRGRRDNLFREEEFSGCNVDSRSGRKNMRWRSVMCTPVLTKASAIESIKCCVSLQKERFAFTLRRLTRRIVLSNQEGGRKRAPSVCNVHLRADRMH